MFDNEIKWRKYKRCNVVRSKCANIADDLLDVDISGLKLIQCGLIGFHLGCGPNKSHWISSDPPLSSSRRWSTIFAHLASFNSFSSGLLFVLLYGCIMFNGQSTRLTCSRLLDYLPRYVLFDQHALVTTEIPASYIAKIIKITFFTLIWLLINFDICGVFETIFVECFFLLQQSEISKNGLILYNLKFRKSLFTC